MSQVQLSDIYASLFCPANAPRRLARALSSSASAVIVDLEDAVPPTEKVAARRMAEGALGGRAPRGADGPPVVLRINGAGTVPFDDDVAIARELPLVGLMLPKATAASLAALGPDGPPVWALVETALGLHEVTAIAAHPRVAVLMLGTVDLAVDLGLGVRADGLELLHARSALVLASRVARILPPIDGVCLAVDDEAALREQAALARDLGFGGKACIHPRQLEPVRAAFAVSAQQREWAERVLRAYEQAAASGSGAVLVDGRLVDQPIVDQARRILGV